MLRFTTTTSVFLLFNSNLFFLFSSNNRCTNSFSADNTVSSGYLKLFMLCPATLIPIYPSRFRIIFTLQRDRSGESTHPSLTPRFFFSFKMTDFSINAHCYCLFSAHGFNHSSLFFHLSSTAAVG